MNKEMMIQNEIVRYISSSLEISKLMHVITDSIIKEIGISVCAIALSPSAVHNEKLTYRVKSEFDEKYNNNLAIHIEKYCFDEYIKGTQTYVDNHVNKVKYSFLTDSVLGSMLIVPLVRGGERIGMLYVAHRAYDFFADNRAFFEAIVAQFMIALHNANLYHQMELMAIRDGLTGINNRRVLTKLFEEEVKRAKEVKQPLSVVILDIDKFKLVNDTYGHGAGDLVIQAIAKAAEKIAQLHNGIVARYGGEEFVLLFPNMSIRETGHRMSILQEEIRAKEVLYKKEKIKVTISMGITSYPEVCKEPEEMLIRADKLMYYSKQNGRNCITLDHEHIWDKISSENTFLSEKVL